MKKALLLAASVALTGSAMAQQLAPVSASASKPTMQAAFQRQLPNAPRQFGELKAGVRHIGGVDRNLKQLAFQGELSAPVAYGTSKLPVLSMAERVAQFQSPKVSRNGELKLASLSLTAAGNGPVNGLDSLYYAYGYFYDDEASSQTTTQAWEMHVSPYNGDTVLLQNFMPLSYYNGETKLLGIYKNNTLKVLNGQYVAYYSSNGTNYDLFFSDYMNRDEESVDLIVSADGSAISTPSGTYCAYLVQERISEEHEFDGDASIGFWDLMYAADYSTDASIQPNIRTIYGKGIDLSTYGSTYWETKIQEGANDTVWFADVIPPFVSSLSDITTYGIRKGNKITIPYGEVLYTYSNNTYAINLVQLNFTSDSYTISSITFDEAEDGTLSVPEGCTFAYWVSPIVDGKADVYDDGCGYYSAVTDVEYSAAEWGVKAPTVSAEPDGVILYALADDSYSPYGPYAVATANANYTYTNKTPAPYDSLYWATYEYDGSASTLVVANTITSTDETLKFNTGYKNFWGSPDLYAWNGGEMGAANVNATNYFTSYGTILIFPYGSYSEFDDDNGGYYHFSSAQIDRKLSRTNYFQETAENGEKISSLYSYQGKPNGVLYFETVSLAAMNLASSSATSDLKLLIRYCSRDAEGNIIPGDTIAISDANISNWKATDTSDDGEWGFLTFNEFYSIDEDGFDVEFEEGSFFNIADEFMFELQGFDESEMTGYFLTEYSYDANGSKYTAYSTADAPQVLKYDEYANARLFFCYDNFISGLLLTDDETSVRVPEDGGIYSWTVTPMYSAVDASGNATTGIWVDPNTEDPEWLVWSVVSENYTTDQYFVLQIAVDALPAGMTGRSAVMHFQQWGAGLNIELLQGDAVSGIESVNVQTRAYKAMVNGNNIEVSCPADVKNVTLYDATGARVATVPVVGGKAVIPGARQGLNIVNFGGKNSVKVVK